MNREQFIELVLTHPAFEGGAKSWVDPVGGLTKYGFSQRAYPKLNIAELTLDKAKELAFVDYWQACRCDEMGSLMFAGTVFDFALNSGQGRAIRYLQTVLGQKVDGIVGPKTLMACLKAPDAKVNDYLAHRALFMASLPNFKDNGKGWFRRLFTLSQVIHGGSI